MTDALHIIAEAGTNHGGQLDCARRLVDVAGEAGADSVKFQILYPEGLYLPSIWENGECRENEVFLKRAAGMLEDDDYRKLADYCRERGVPLTASVFDERGINLVDELDVPYIKIASCDLNHSALLRAAAERNRPMIISTGMSSLGEIEKAVKTVTDSGNLQIVLMHCVSVYPCPTEQINLGFIRILQEAFGFPVGLSDHSEENTAGILAVGMGIRWFEKHFTLDRSAEGFDHAYAMEPRGLTQYVRDLRTALKALQAPLEKVGSGERSVRKRARRSLYASRNLSPGKSLTESDVLVVRPEGELAPDDLGRILGKAPNKSVRKYQELTWDAFF